MRALTSLVRHEAVHERLEGRWKIPRFTMRPNTLKGQICLCFSHIRAPHKGPECTKIAHRCSLTIFTADEGLAGNSAARIIFTCFHRRQNRGSLATFFAEEIAHLGASKRRAIFPGAVKIAAATAENRAMLVHSARGRAKHVEKCRRIFLTLWGTFFLTWALSAGPF